MGKCLEVSLQEKNNVNAKYFFEVTVLYIDGF